MFRFGVTNHGSDYAHTMIDRSSGGLVNLIVDFDLNLHNAQSFSVGLPQDFRTCTHVCLDGINGVNRSARIGSESTLGICHLVTVPGPKIREFSDYSDSEFPVPR